MLENASANIASFAWIVVLSNIIAASLILAWIKRGAWLLLPVLCFVFIVVFILEPTPPFGAAAAGQPYPPLATARNALLAVLVSIIFWGGSKRV